MSSVSVGTEVDGTSLARSRWQRFELSHQHPKTVQLSNRNMTLLCSFYSCWDVSLPN